MLPSTLNSKLRILNDEEKTGNRLKAIRQFIPDPRSPKEMTEFLTDLYQSGRIAKGNPWGTGAVYLGKRGLSEIPTIKKALTGLDNITNNLKSNIPRFGRKLATETTGSTGLKINTDSNPNVLFSKTREANKGVLNPQGVPIETTKGYQRLQNIQIDPETGRPLAKTATHHMSGIADSTTPIKNRVDGDKLLQSAKREGIPVGDELTNYISLPDVLTKGTRISKVDQLAKQFPNVNRRSINDALGATEFSKQPMLKSDEIADRRIWQGVKEKTGLKNLYGEFKPGSTQGPFPSINLYDANNKLVREWKPKTLKEWGTRWDVINKHYGSNLTQDVVNKIKVDPKLNTYGADHKLVHDTLKDVDSFKAIQTLMKEGKWSTLPFNQADVMYKKMLRDQHKVAINMANWRYGKITEYFKKLNPNKVFSRLSPGEQAAFFKKNISEISSLGSLKELPTKKELLKNTNFGFKDMLKSNKRRDALEAIFGLKSPVGDLRIKK